MKISHTHDHELSHSMVHYLLAIHKLKESLGYARVTDIAKSLNLTKGSVSVALTGLKKKNLVIEDESRFLSLSDAGHQEVHAILTSRTLLFYFFRDILALEEQTAHKDSCLMEHLMSEETRVNLFKFMKNITEINNQTPYKLSLDLHRYNTLDDFLVCQKGDSHL
jgi:DtxR family Mn-dependent transcriptional regulator